MLLHFDSKNIQMIIGTKHDKGFTTKNKPSRKNLQNMLHHLQANLKKNKKFKEPLMFHSMKIRFDLLSDLCKNIREKLISENKAKARVKEYRPLFAYTWVIML